MNRLPALLIGLVLPAALAAESIKAPLELRQIMADPEWIGSPVEAAWWQLDGTAINYRIKRDGSSVRDIHRIELESGRDSLVEYAEHHRIDGERPVFHPDSGRAVFARNGNLFLHEPGREPARQLTRSTSADSQPGFSSDGTTIRFQRGNQWWLYDIDAQLARPVADLRFEADPDREPEDELAQMQLRLFSSLRNDAERERLERTEAERAAREDPTRAPEPWYLGDDYSPVASSLSPDGRWLLLALEPAEHEQGQAGKMPRYVTVDGYNEVEDVRTRVGRKPPAPETLWLLDLSTRERHPIEFDPLPGISDDPLAELKARQDIDPLPDDGQRPISIMGMRWHPESHRVAVMLRANDNKDRWIATVDPLSPALNPRHRLTDDAWINWSFNDFGWLGRQDRLWFLSEESGYSHLYTVSADDGAPQARTSGDFEVMDPVPDFAAERVFVRANRSHPSEYDLYRLDLDSDDLVRLSEQRAIESFALLPGHDQILVRFSQSYRPAQAGIVPRAGGPVRHLTDTRSERFRAMDWQPPQIVAIESSHVDRPIWAKFYPARSPAPEGGHPAVLFVHGAGYLQNTLVGYPNYFREQMFHNLLTERGYHVLDMDFRASKGYGRDWRTAIYRRMGTPELEDLIDGVDWLVAEHGVDPARVGLYGGSYGGFMTFMALFKAPEVFAAGAALRPVSDWHHYNHPYTSNILNTPQVDPEAYERSSPIEFAEGLQGHLLMTHGMLDDNVFYQDVVRLAQRLIDLEKDNWELASYPLEGHGFRRPSSWRDQYQRILELFETTIGD
jgi:dipeptidyl aminopeptidase/acylaminoacyl peptidase